MFEALVYLYENYFEADIRPDRNSLVRELHAAGFESVDIDSALGWFGAFDQPPHRLPLPGSGLRIYSEAERRKLGSDSLGFLMLQEQVGALDAVQRELVIDRAMALPLRQVPTAAVRQIMRMALQLHNRHERQPLAEGALLQQSNTQLH